MASEITLDTTEFRQAMIEYEAATGKDNAEALNHQIVNWGIKASQLTRIASAEAIRRVKSEYKLSAWLLLRKVGKEPRVSRMYRKAVCRVSKTGKVSWRKSKERVRGRAARYTLEEFRQFRKRHFGRRLSAVKFLKSFFVKWAQQFQPTGGRTARQMRAQSKRATAEQPEAIVSVAYPFKANLIKSAAYHGESTEKILMFYLNRAIPAVINDMRQHIERKMAQRARQFSARGAK